MASLKPRTVPYQRRRQQKTNYRKRLRLLLSKQSRLVVRLTNQRVIGQLIQFDTHGDRVLAGADSFELKKLGWQYSCKNTPAAYLTGLLLGQKALAAGVKEAVFDTGLQTPQNKGRLYAFLKGTVDAGLQVPHQPEVFPDAQRLMGAHIEQHMGSPKGTQFAQYLKSGLRAQDLPKQFATIKSKIGSK